MLIVNTLYHNMPIVNTLYDNMLATIPVFCMPLNLVLYIPEYKYINTSILSLLISAIAMFYDLLVSLLDVITLLSWLHQKHVQLLSLLNTAL